MLGDGLDREPSLSGDRYVFHVGPDGSEPDGGEDIEGALILPADFPYPELLALGDFIAAADVLTPGYIPPPVGLCHPDGFIYEKNFEDIKTVLLPDRNVASRFAQIAKGALVDDAVRPVAALLAFSHFLDIEVEPSVAFHELAHKQGNAIANEELAWLRQADNASAHAKMDVALGRVERLVGLAQPASISELDLAFPLRRWRRNYIVTLKIGELELAGLPHLDRILALLDWMHRDFIVAGPAAMLACIYFAPNSPPRKGLLKQLQSADRARAIEGAKNAAWDITHLSDFVHRVNEAADGSTRYLFASLDRTLHYIARSLFDFGADGIRQDNIICELGKWWPQEHARAIAERMADLFESIDQQERVARRPQAAGFVDSLIHSGEAALLQWSPTSGADKKPNTSKES
ncbi:hypothetical protein Lcho_1313 [Leptothrix cholodnii SP-6]|uniref:Uncharacterized protein n=1 Tax=Leptothrix cholodnii (strain ATCC 51168 / LMG 8142 / SP-6) TaxID=395495 RepID=B1Y677_LEPCP|nr:hypothetical protein [Leptothrix cholodnii]ACB33582.1 hypothetical protein Lcho_1313 [Leptothrix cholodnii SP-6]